MNEAENLFKDVLEVFAAIYKIPGQYFIIGLLFLGSWEVSKNGNPYAIMLLILSIFFFMIEILVPVAAGYRILNRIITFFQS